MNLKERGKNRHGINITDALFFELCAEALNGFRDCDCDWDMVIVEVVARPGGAVNDGE